MTPKRLPANTTYQALLGEEETPNGLRQPPPAVSPAENRGDAHCTEMEKRRGRAGGGTRCWALERQ